MKLLGTLNSARAARVTGALVIAILGAGWLAWAETEFTGIVYGCVTPAGRIRGIDDATGKCRRHDEAIAWYTKQGAEATFLGRLATAANANTLDGLDSTAFALGTHNHDGRYITVDGAGHYLLAGGKAADADLLDGLDSSQFVRATDLAALTARVAALESEDDDDDDPSCPSDPAACPTEPVDVVFLVDTTGDMEGAIANLKSTILTTLTTTLLDHNPNTAFGVAAFQDFPTAPFGSMTDQPYQLLTPVTTNFNAVVVGINSLQSPNGSGSDSLESGHEALYQLATGAGTLQGGANVPASNIGFREGSKRVVIVITSADFHSPDDYPFSTHGATDALQALNAIDARVVGIAVGADATGADAIAFYGAMRAMLESYAIQTGAVVPPSAFGEAVLCKTGINGLPRAALSDGTCPLVFELSRTGVGLNSAAIAAALLAP